MSVNEQAHTIDKSKWPDGPWMSEPDKVQFRTRAGLPGLIVRNHVGALCGYVAVSEGHPCFEKDYDDMDIDVHGGLTYADHCQGVICHIPEPGEPDRVWWLGWDNAHLGDLVPGMRQYYFRPILPETYATMETVREQVESVAEQLVELGQTP